MMRKRFMKSVAVSGVAVVAVLGFEMLNPASAAPAEKVTICHATGQIPSDHYVTLSTKALTPLGAEGHIDANGTPLAGHEQDFVLGAGQECPCDKKY